MSLLLPLALLVLSIPLVLALVRANELFFVTFREGRLRVRRGALPRELLGDLEDVLRAGSGGPAELRGVVEDRAPRLYAEGDLSDAQRQQLRNAIGRWPLAKIRSAKR